MAAIGYLHFGMEIAVKWLAVKKRKVICLACELDNLIKMANSARITRIKYLSKDEVERFFCCVKDLRDRALFGVIYHYGLRVSEATILKFVDVDLKRKRIFIRRIKGGNGGERPIFSSTEKLLKKYLAIRQKSGDGLFTGRQGNLGRKRMYQLFKSYAQKAGLDPKFTVHSMRHSIATHLLEAGEGIEFVKDHLGHTNIQNTMIYAQITDNIRTEAFRRIEKSSKIAKI